jgi:hypothetical protein
MGFGPGSQSVVFATMSRGAFQIRSKVFSAAQDSDVLKICEIKANRNALLGLAIEYRLT